MMVENPQDYIHLSDKKGYVYVRIPKTGSRSLTRIIYGDVCFPHWTCEEWIKKIGIKKWEDTFKLSIVRNPYDRFLSTFYYFNFFGLPKDPNYFLSNNSLIKFCEKNEEYKKFLRPQSDYIFDDKNSLMVDILGKLENIEHFKKTLKKKLGISSEVYPHFNKTNCEKEILTEESKKIIYNFYKRDFELLEYNQNANC